MLKLILNKFEILFLVSFLLASFGFGNSAEAISVLSWCTNVVETCPAGSVEKVVGKSEAVPNSAGSGETLQQNLRSVCNGGINWGCVKGKSTNCASNDCETVTFCCAAPGTGTAPNKCVENVANGCGVKSPDSQKSYECTSLADQDKCQNKGGEFVANDPSGTIYPSCGMSGCCIIPKCQNNIAAPVAAVKPPSEFKLTNPLGTASVPVILGRIIKTFLGVVGGIALMVFVYGGLMWMTARGDQSQVKKGQDALRAATIGLFIVMFSYTLAGNLVSFLTSEQQTIASEESRTQVEKPTEAGNQAATISSQLKEADQKEAAGQAGASAAGQAAGVTPPPGQTGQSGCDAPNLTPAQKASCLQGAVAGWIGSGQSTYNTPTPQSGQTGGQKNCEYAVDKNKCSDIGWKTVCNEKVYDTGYGTYNNASCMTQADCTSQGGSKLQTSNFGNKCGNGIICCKLPK